MFQEQPVTAYTYTCNPYAEIQGYSFRLLKVEDVYDGEIDYPSKIILIATNDQNHSIAYTAFYDDDIDIIESFESFVMEDCGWKHIVK